MRAHVYNQAHNGYSHLLGVYRHQALKIAKGFRDRLGEWRRRVRRRNELMTLSGRDLRDFRWTRADAETEVRKPFWRA
jgi:uncharacterized protein YjiS (DUF1127 family)